jgi:hypothetical protein
MRAPLRRVYEHPPADLTVFMNVDVSAAPAAGFLHPQPREVEVIAFNRVALVTQHLDARQQKVVSNTPKRWIILDTASLTHGII